MLNKKEQLLDGIQIKHLYMNIKYYILWESAATFKSSQK